MSDPESYCTFGKCRSLAKGTVVVLYENKVIPGATALHEWRCAEHAFEEGIDV